MSDAHSIEVDDGDGVRVVSLRGEHDFGSAPRLREALREASDDGRSVVVELSIASFIDSTILGAIIGGLRRASECGLGFTLVVSPRAGHGVVRVLELTGLLAVFPTYRDREQAVRAARAGIHRPVDL